MIGRWAQFILSMHSSHIFVGEFRLESSKTDGREMFRVLKKGSLVVNRAHISKCKFVQAYLALNHERKTGSREAGIFSFFLFYLFI